MNGSVVGEDALENLFKRVMEQMPFKCEESMQETRCDQRNFHVFLMGHGFLFVFMLAMFGNCINLLIYNSDQIRFYLAIRMLCTRLLMNCATMLFLLPHGLRTIGAWEENSATDKLYWKYYPFQAYFVNVFGFFAMWITVFMTAECYIHIFYPNNSKSLCTKRNLFKCNLICFMVGAVLALNYPLNREATVSEDRCQRVVVTIQASNNVVIQALERVITVAHLLLAILIPMALLIFMTIAVMWKLVLKRDQSTSHFTAEKRCVTRITLITTSLQLIAELPPIPVFIYAIVGGPNVINQSAICAWNTIGVFLGLCNMSLSFFVYVALSQKFRQMVQNRLYEVARIIFPCAESRNKTLDSDRTARSLVSNRNTKERKETMLLAEAERSTNDAYL